jgi:hypothetical protein
MADYMDRVGYTPDEELRAIINIIRDPEAPERTKLGAIHMLHQRRTQALEQEGQLLQGRLTIRSGPHTLEQRRVMRAIGSVQQALEETKTHDSLKEQQHPDRSDLDGVSRVREGGPEGPPGAAGPRSDGPREDDVRHRSAEPGGGPCPGNGHDDHHEDEDPPDGADLDGADPDGDFDTSDGRTYSE